MQPIEKPKNEQPKNEQPKKTWQEPELVDLSVETGTEPGPEGTTGSMSN